MAKVKVIAKYIPISPRKVRLLTDLIKHKKVNEALAQLRVELKYAKVPIQKLLKSAVSAAENKKLDVDRLKISEVRVDNGPISKKQKIKPRGRADLQKRRTSHITIILTDEENPKSKILESDSSKIQNLNLKQKLNKKIPNKK